MSVWGGGGLYDMAHCYFDMAYIYRGKVTCGMESLEMKRRRMRRREMKRKG